MTKRVRSAVHLEATEYARRVLVSVSTSTSDYLMDVPYPMIGYESRGPTVGGKSRLDALLGELVSTSRGRLSYAEDETLGFHGDKQLSITLWGVRPVRDRDVERLLRRLAAVRVPRGIK